MSIRPHARERIDAHRPYGRARRAAAIASTVATTATSSSDRAGRRRRASSRERDRWRARRRHRARHRGVPAQALPRDEQQHVARRRAERDSHSELARTRRDHVREHAIDSDRREHKATTANAAHSASANRLGARSGPARRPAFHVARRERRIGWRSARLISPASAMASPDVRTNSVIVRSHVSWR